MGAAAPIGAGASIVGTGINSYGQYQGLRAQRAAIDDQMGAQRGFDAQLRARTDELIKQIFPDAIDGQPVAQANQAKLDNVSRNTANAVAAAGGRRRGGSAAGVESRAVTAQNTDAILANALKDDRVQAAMQALAGSGQKMDILGRAYGGDAGRIRGDAQRWASALMPLQQAAAGYQGQFARQIGSLFNMGGQGLMMAGMAAPAGGGSAAGAGAAQAPQGGWAADRIYDMPGGGQGAWS